MVNLISRGCVRNLITSSDLMDRQKALDILLESPALLPTVEIRESFQNEKVEHVRKGLKRILDLSKTDDLHDLGIEADIKSDEVRQELASEVKKLVGRIEHDVAPFIGRGKVALRAEVKDYRNTDSYRAFENLDRMLQGVMTLARVTIGEKATTSEVDFLQILEENWPEESRIKTPIFKCESLAEDPTIRSNEGVLGLLVSNIFRNAIEAAIQSGELDGVSVRWGTSDKLFWLRVTNPFEGESFESKYHAGVGVTSKEGHQGRGMEIIFNCAAALGVDVKIEGKGSTATTMLNGDR